VGHKILIVGGEKSVVVESGDSGESEPLHCRDNDVRASSNAEGFGAIVQESFSL